MIDFALYNVCDHKVFEELDIEGISPNYYADLKYLCNPNTSLIKIFDANKATSEELFSMQGVGISNFYVDASNKKIIFGRYPIEAGTNFPDVNELHVPSDKYFCSYIAQKSECPKCNGSGTVKDIYIDRIGRIATISGKNKVSQQILKALMTLQGTNLYDESYGSVASNLIGTKIDSYIAASLQFSILDCLTKLMETQQANNLPDDETISSISDVNAERDSIDPRKININITVMLQSYERNTTSLTITM
jgi:hypothetical protein